MVEREVRSLYDGYLLHVEQLNPILERMSERGIPVDRDALDKFGEEIDELKARTYKELCELYPRHLLPAQQAKGYVKEPANTEGLLQRTFSVEVPILETIELECTCKRGCKKCGGTRIVRKSRKTGAKERREELRWYRPKEFKPSKEQIIEYILYHEHKVPQRAIKKGEPGSEGKRTKITTNRVALQTLYRQTGDKFYHLVLLYRNYAKLRSSYVGDSAETAQGKIAKGKRPNRGWQPASDGRVHAAYLFRPASGQLSSVGPNVQNAIGEKGGELGVRFKNCIRAREGYVLQEFDYTGLHAYMLGFLAGDAQYMRLSRLGIHDFVTANIVASETPRHIAEIRELQAKEEKNRRYAGQLDAKLESLESAGLPTTIQELAELYDEVRDAKGWISLDDSALSKRLGFIKGNFKKLRNKIKPAVHGYGFGLGAFKLYTSYPESFANQKEAQAPLDMLNALFPLVAKYREDSKELADAQGYLITPFGFMRYFHNVFTYAPAPPNYQLKFGEKLMKKGKSGKLYVRRSGVDAEKAIAYGPSNCSFGYKKDAMLSIARKGYDQRWGMINEIHDSLMFEHREEETLECRKAILAEMQYHSPLLVSELAPEGLVCYAGAALGKSWGAMKEAA